MLTQPARKVFYVFLFLNNVFSFLFQDAATHSRYHLIDQQTNDSLPLNGFVLKCCEFSNLSHSEAPVSKFS